MTRPKGLKNARRLLRSVAARAFEPEPVLTVSSWADHNRILSSKASGEPGQWETSRTPYLRELMDAMSLSHPCKDLAFMKGTQIGGSETIYNAIGYIADRVPCPVMLVMPTTDGGKKVSRQRIGPMIDETPSLRAKFASQKSRDSANTMQMKDFPGGMLVIVGANSGPGLRNMPMRVVLQDEVDAFPDSVDDEGDPCTVADKRTDQFSARAKRVKCSTPKIAGKSRIEKYYLAGTQGKFHLPCPHCRHEQALRWEQMRWEMIARRELTCRECGGVCEVDEGAAQASCEHCGASVALDDGNTQTVNSDELARVWYECEACGAEIAEHNKTWMLENGRYIHAQPGAGEVLPDDSDEPFAIWAKVRGQVARFLPRWVRPMSWHVSALYSPLGWKSWFDCVNEFLASQKGGYIEDTGESLEQVFYNTVRGEAYEVKGEQPEVNILKQRVESYALGTVPARALMLTAFVDVQGDRLEVEVDGFGRGEETWTIEHQIIHGDPRVHGAGSVWEALEQIRDKGYPHAGGSTIRITAMGVDSGYLTQDVYQHCRKWANKHVIATKGASEPGKPIISAPKWIDFNHQGRKIKRGVQLIQIGTDTAKERFYARLELGVDKESGKLVDRDGDGFQHFPRGLSDEYFDQITSEKLIRRTVRGRQKNEWIKTRERNEALDLKIGCYAIAVYAGLQRVPWDALEQAINPTQRDIFADAATTETPKQSSTAQASPVQRNDDGADADTADELAEVPAKPPVRRLPRRGGWVNGFR